MRLSDAGRAKTIAAIQARRWAVERGRMTLAEALAETAEDEMRRWDREQRQQGYSKRKATK